MKDDLFKQIFEGFSDLMSDGELILKWNHGGDPSNPLVQTEIDSNSGHITRMYMLMNALVSMAVNEADNAKNFDMLFEHVIAENIANLAAAAREYNYHEEIEDDDDCEDGWIDDDEDDEDGEETD